jgi:multicomponent Na+:H+ antiporter subunit A
VLTGLAVAVNVLLVAVAGIAGLGPFVGRLATLPKRPHEAPVSLWLGPVLLAAGGLLIGVVPILAEPLLAAAAASVLGGPAPVSLTLWHGFNVVLALSALTLALGAGAYLGRESLRRITIRWDLGPRWGPDRWYDLLLAGLDTLAHALTGWLQNGYLRSYMVTILATTVGLVGFTLGTRGLVGGVLRRPDAALYEVGLAVLILLAALMAVVTSSRLAAVGALGVVGYGVALVYLEFGAPDLAMTQILVETLTVILFVLVFSFLPRFATLSDTRRRVRDAAAALITGGLMTTLVLVGSAIRFDPSIPDFYAEQSVPAAHGRNVVNVILVDFRALDTLGEITVLSLAALGVYALLKLRPSGEPTGTARRPPKADDRIEDRTGGRTEGR